MKTIGRFDGDKAVDPKVNLFLHSDRWTTAEKLIIQWQFRLLGHFRAALFEAIVRADDGNLEKIQRGFPEEVAGFLAWNRGDLARRLRDAGLDV